MVTPKDVIFKPNCLKITPFEVTTTIYFYIAVKTTGRGNHVYGHAFLVILMHDHAHAVNSHEQFHVALKSYDTKKVITECDQAS